MSSAARCPAIAIDSRLFVIPPVASHRGTSRPSTQSTEVVPGYEFVFKCMPILASVDGSPIIRAVQLEGYSILLIPNSQEGFFDISK